uniref:UBX domain-containing protein n=1 Tax=Ditylenchus dipsaci TaxID=166011 RepID=A0A915EDH4_9BILA
MRMQEEEYARSLAADKAKREERLRAELVFKEEEQRAKDQAEKAENKRVGGAKECDDIVCIKVKFSEGSVFSRRFRANHSVEELFNSVLLHEKCRTTFSSQWVTQRFLMSAERS